MLIELSREPDMALASVAESSIVTPREDVIVDFCNVSVFDDRLFSALITLYKRTKAAGYVLTLCHVNARVLDVMKQTRLDQIFAVDDSPT
jgi:anti-anti-sigma factor